GARAFWVGFHDHPDHRLAALNAVVLGFLAVGQARQLLAEVDQVAVKLFPTAEEFEVRDELFECHFPTATPSCCSRRSQTSASSSSRRASCLTRSMISPANAWMSMRRALSKAMPRLRR